jgi:hydrogenase maturation protease
MVVCIAIGNTLREDDGVAHYALRLIEPGGQVRLLEVFQLTPELACEIASANLVFFLDADPSTTTTVLAPIEIGYAHSSPLAHSMSPADVVALARDLYAFAGKALLCRIPARQFGYGEELTAEAKAAACGAAKMMTEYIAQYAANGSRLGLVKN